MAIMILLLSLCMCMDISKLSCRALAHRCFVMQINARARWTSHESREVGSVVYMLGWISVVAISSVYVFVCNWHEMAYVGIVAFSIFIFHKQIL